MPRFFGGRSNVRGTTRPKLHLGGPRRLKPQIYVGSTAVRLPFRTQVQTSRRMPRQSGKLPHTKCQNRVVKQPMHAHANQCSRCAHAACVRKTALSDFSLLARRHRRRNSPLTPPSLLNDISMLRESEDSVAATNQEIARPSPGLPHAALLWRSPDKMPGPQ
jgi:hypothetical protein